MGNKNQQHDLLRGEVKPAVPCKFLWHVKDPYNMKEMLVGQIQRSYLTRFLPASLLGVFAGYRQRTLVGESGINRNQMGKHNRSVG
jgi:hypothetical protein